MNNPPEQAHLSSPIDQVHEPARDLAYGISAGDAMLCASLRRTLWPTRVPSTKC